MTDPTSGNVSDRADGGDAVDTVDTVPEPVAASGPAPSSDGRGDGLPRKFHKPHRLAALSDGVFAIAMTLLALEVRVPEDVATVGEFNDAVAHLLGELGIYAIAFVIVAQYWMGNHRVLSYVHTVDARGIALTIPTLAGVAALPAAAALITTSVRYPLAIVIAAGLLALTSLVSARMYAYVLRAEFADIDPAHRRPIVVHPLVNAAVYLLSMIPALLLSQPPYAMFLWTLLAFGGQLTRWLVGLAERRTG